MISRFAVPLLAVCLPAHGLCAPESADRIRENEQRQAQLSVDARQLVGALDAMLGEYARNQIAGEDVLVVQNLRASIERLSTAEMRQVIDLLQQARAVPDAGTGTRTVADAFSAQKQIVVRIQRILAEHGRRQQAQEFARQINDLADRQARNLKDGIELGRLAGDAQPENFEAVKLAQLEIQRGEQAAIAAELKVVTESVQRFANDPRNADVMERFRASATQLRQVQPRAEAAESALAAGQLFKAVAEEKINRDELRKIARTMAPRERGQDALRQAERELAQLIHEQESLKAETAKQKKDTDFEKWIEERMADIDPNRTLEGQFRRLTPEQRRQSPELRAKFDAEQSAKATQLARMEDDQGELSVKTDDLGQNLTDVPKANEALNRATSAMQEARNAMQEADATVAQQRQAEAVNRMQAAHAELQKKAEEAELLAANSGDKIRDLERLRAAVENLANEETAISKAGQPDATQQADAVRRAAQLAQRSSELAPAASPALRQGTAHTEQSRAAIEQNQNEPARQQAAQAAHQFTQAAQQIAQALANAQQAAEQRERAQAALAELAKLIEAEQKLDLQTARTMAAGDAAAVRKLAPEQAAIEQRTAAFKGSLSGGMITAVQALNDAENAMLLAREALQKNDGTEARKMEAQAVARLFDAQKSINASADPARQALDQRFADAGAMAQAANQLSQAMQEVNAAQARLQQAAEQMGQQAAQSAAEAAQQAAEAARAAARSAQAAGQQAQRAANQPAAQRAENAAQLAQQAAQSATQAAQSAQAMANQNGEAAVQSAQQAAQQAGEAAQAANQAATSANQAQRAANAASASAAENQAAAQQAAAASQSAQTAAEAARRAQQLAKVAAESARNSAQAAGKSMQQAAGQLSRAATQAGQAAAQQASSPGMQQAIQQAAQKLANAAAQAMNGQNASAQRSAQQAAQQLAQASGMAEAMQAGIGQPSAGQMPGQGQQGAMPGQGMQGAGRQPGQGQGSGPTKDSNQPSEGATGYQAGSPEAVQRAARQAALKKAGFLGLPARERAAIQQSLSEKYPQEFGPLVEQYLLNLANEPARK
jgi:trimeric autotransporter adhesin